MESEKEDNNLQFPLPTGDLWEQKYMELVEFRLRNLQGMPLSMINGKPNPLYLWIQIQRKNKSSLSQARIDKLNTVGFIWKIMDNNYIWEQHYRGFLDFRKTHLSGMPPANINKKPNPLYKWCITQRKKKDKLSAVQIEKLNAAGFEWESEFDLCDEVWERNFLKFVQFKAANPYSMPSYEKDESLNPLYTWCFFQRRNKSKLGPDKIEKLTLAGFIWENDGITSSWEKYYREFLKFRRKNPVGMPKRYAEGQDNYLQSWCYKQISKKHHLSSEQIKRLDEVGFIWKKKDLDAAWEKNYREFVAFRKANPNNMPPSHANGKANPLHSWYIIQRDRKYRLSPNRISKLNAAGFEWNIVNDDNAWEKNFLEFKQFTENNPGKMPPWDTSPGANNSLYQWCFRQRRFKNKLSEERMKRLEEYGFIWEIKNYSALWEQHYREYVNFRMDNPGKILQDKKDGNPLEKSLYKWSKWQSREKGQLTPEQIQKLNDVGFDWEMNKEGQEKAWNKWFREFLNFRKSTPQGMPERLNKKGLTDRLYNWCTKQCINKHLLSDDQIAMLNEVGFVWEIKNKQEKWDKMYKKFLSFIKNNPDILSIPGKFKKTGSLYAWCSVQRNAKARLSPEQIKKLDDACFPWKAKDKVEAWEQHYQEYLEWRKIKPTGMPVGFLNGKANPLHNWCRLQQKFKHKLSPERIKKLEDADFVWYVRTPDWMVLYNEFLEFRKRFKEGMPGNHIAWQNKRLYKWCIEQRKNKEKLLPDFIEKLNEAGFEWK